MSDGLPLTLSLRGATLHPASGLWRYFVLDTSQGDLVCRLYEAEGAASGIVWLGDAHEGFASPSDGLFERLAERFQARGALSLRVQYRDPADPPQCGLDAMVATHVLREQGLERVVVVGHGLGAIGAVQVGRVFPFVAAVALLAPWAIDADVMAGLRDKPLWLAPDGDETAESLIDDLSAWLTSQLPPAVI